MGESYKEPLNGWVFQNLWLMLAPKQVDSIKYHRQNVNYVPIFNWNWILFFKKVESIFLYRKDVKMIHGQGLRLRLHTDTLMGYIEIHANISKNAKTSCIIWIQFKSIFNVYWELKVNFNGSSNRTTEM